MAPRGIVRFDRRLLPRLRQPPAAAVAAVGGVPLAVDTFQHPVVVAAPLLPPEVAPASVGLRTCAARNKLKSWKRFYARGFRCRRKRKRYN
jgi:hypothetical protein